MGKRVDITDKLDLTGNPCLVIQEKELEVRADAPTALKVMGVMNTDNPGTDEIMEAYNLLFTEQARNVIENELKLVFRDLLTVVEEAVQLIMGTEEKKQGEQ